MAANKSVTNTAINLFKSFIKQVTNVTLTAEEQAIQKAIEYLKNDRGHGGKDKNSGGSNRVSQKKRRIQMRRAGY